MGRRGGRPRSGALSLLPRGAHPTRRHLGHAPSVRASVGTGRRPHGGEDPDGDPGGLRLMATPIRMPSLGQTTEEHQIVEWLKAEGDAVAPGEPLLTVQTDKATLEVE